MKVMKEVKKQQEHFEDIQPILIDYANYTPEKEDGTIVMDKEAVRGLLLQNLLLRRIVAK